MLSEAAAPIAVAGLLSALALLVLLLAEIRWKRQLAAQRSDLRPYAVRLLAAALEAAILHEDTEAMRWLGVAIERCAAGELDPHLDSIPLIPLTDKPQRVNLLHEQIRGWLRMLPIQWPEDVAQMLDQPPKSRRSRRSGSLPGPR